MRPLALPLVVIFLACTNDASRRTQAQLEELKKKHADALKAQKAEKLAPPPIEWAVLDPPYDDLSTTKISPDSTCPEGMWALFPGDPPGETPEEKKDNGAKRKQLADELRSKVFMVKLRGPPTVVLKPYDPPSATFPIEVLGTIDCMDSGGRLAISWTDAKAMDPGASAAKQGAEVTQNIWFAPPATFTLPMKTMLEAKDFNEKNKLALSARVVFRIGKAEVDKKLKRIGKVTDKPEAMNGETLGYGGGVEDWGAGRLVRAELIGLRVATNREKTMLFDQRGPMPSPTANK